MMVSGAVAQIKGPLRVNPANPRYFTDGTGKAVLLAGSHTWASVFDQGPSDPPPHFNITQFLDFLQSNGHNFTRTFVWEQSRRGTWSSDTNYWFYPGPPWKRTGPGVAADGKPQWNLDSLDQNYFDWIRARVDSFSSRGIYVSIQLFDGWSVSSRGLPGDPWLDHPMRSTNNVNGIDGGSSDGTATQSLSIPAIWPIQMRYIKKLIDELNGYDNVLWEISNESSYDGSNVWEQRIIDTVRAYELSKPKQHPIGFTADWYAPLLNPTVFGSKADWVSPGAGNNGDVWKDSPPDSAGRKVVINDTDHLWGNGGDATWVWKTFCRGNNILYMDGYDGAAYATGHPWTSADSANPTVVALRRNMGYALQYANRMNLVGMTPQDSLSSTAYCLQGGNEWLVFQPSSGPFTVNLSSTTDSLSVEWLNPSNGNTTTAAKVKGGSSSTTMTPPFSGIATLYLHAQASTPPAPPLLATPANGATGAATTPTLTWNASSGALSYQLQVSTDPGFASTVIDQSNITATSFAVSGLGGYTPYYWHVSASNSGGSSAYSSIWGFTTGAPPPPPTVPVLASPANGATGVATSPTLTWNASTGATTYHLQVSTDPGFASTVIDQNNITTTSSAVSALATNTLYYWHVSAANGGGSSAYSGAWSFTTSAIPAGLVAAYAFDEGSGTTVTDASGQGLTGTISGATWTTSGKYGKALSFNGTSSYVDLGNPTALQLTGSMTLSAWVNAAANLADDGQIIAKSDGTSGWQFKTSPDTGPETFGFGVSPTSTTITQRYSTTVRSLNTWYHVAGVYNATTQTLDIYVNGVLNDGTLSGTVPASQVNSSVNVNIGRRTGGFYFNGLIDEVRVYNRALTQAEIQTDMNTPLGAPPPPVLATPASGATGVATNPTLTWDTSAGALSYQLQVSTSSNFSTTVYNQTGLTGTSQNISGLANGALYYWRVNATNAVGTSLWSAVWNFATRGASLPPDSWSFAGNTGKSAVITIPASANPTLDGTRGLQTGDAVGVFFLRNDSLICAGYSFWLAGQDMSITAWGDNGQLTMKDGFAEGELIRYKTWDSQAGREYKAVATYVQGTAAYTSGGVYILGSLVGTTNIDHMIVLPVGWNMISSFVAPQDSTVSTLLNKIASRLVLMKNGTGQLYWPQYGIDGIVKWNPRYGYQLYMQSTDTLIVTGSELNPLATSLTMSQGWNMTSYLRNSSMRVDSALATIAGEVVLAKNVQGQLYWPAYGINTIGSMKPGQGYQMYLGSSGTLTYPADAAASPPSILTRLQTVATLDQAIPEPKHYRPAISRTGSNAVLLVEGRGLRNGDEVGVWTASKQLVGGGVIVNQKAVVTAWGNVSLTKQQSQGAGEGEDLTLTLWVNEAQKEKPLNVTSVLDGLTGVVQEEKRLQYQSDGAWIVEAKEGMAVPTQYVLDQNYPNPFNPSTMIRYGIPKDTKVMLEVYNVLGQKVTTLVNQELKAGWYEVLFEGRGLSSGVYFYRLNTAESVISKKLVLLR